MNRTNLVGRLTSKPELKYSKSNVAVVSGTVAVNRKFKNQQTGEYEADFIRIKAFSKTAELLAQYFDKGSQIGISGRIQTGSYDDKDGKRVYTTDVIVEDITFIDSKKEQQEQSNGEIVANAMTEKSTYDPYSNMGQQAGLELDDID